MQISANFFVHIHDHLFRIRTENVGATVPDERGTHLTDIKVHAYITDLDTSKSMYLQKLIHVKLRKPRDGYPPQFL